jgi:hypothetical protein
MGLRLGGQPQLEEDLLDVRLDRSFGDEETVGNALVRESLGNEAQNFSLAFCELDERILASMPADEGRRSSDRRRSRLL